MNFTEYQRLARRTANSDHPQPYPLANWALGLTGEAGEVGEKIKKHVFHGHPLDMDATRKELGDVLWYLAVIADDLGIDLEDVAQRNIAKLRARYPHGFSVEDSAGRVE